MPLAAFGVRLAHRVLLPPDDLSHTFRLWALYLVRYLHFVGREVAGQANGCRDECIARTSDRDICGGAQTSARTMRRASHVTMLRTLKHWKDHEGMMYGSAWRKPQRGF